MRRKIGIIALIIGIFILVMARPVYGQEKSFADSLSLKELDDKFKSLTGNDDFQVENYAKEAVEGKTEVTWKNLVQNGIGVLEKQWKEEKDQFIRIILLGILAGLFTQFGLVVSKREVGETGFFVVYMILFTTVTGAFFQIMAVAKDTMEDLLEFMKVLIPTFSMCLTYVAGSLSATAFYQITMIGMALAETILLKLLIPVLIGYYLMAMVNQLTKEARFTKIAGLFRSFLKWSLKTVFGLVVGMQGIQMLLMPVMDQVKRSLVLRSASGLPGMGNTVRSVAETVIGTGIVVKSAVGVGGVIAILILVAVPLLRIGVFAITYKVCGAMVQPVSDKRVSTMLEITADCGKMLLSVVFMGTLMFVFSIAIAVQGTNGG